MAKDRSGRSWAKKMMGADTRVCVRVCVFQWVLGSLLKLLWWWAWCWRACPSHWLMEAPSPWTVPLLSATGQSAKTARTQTHTHTQISLIKAAESRQCKHLYLNTALPFQRKKIYITASSPARSERSRRFVKWVTTMECVCVCVNTWGMNTGHRFN